VKKLGAILRSPGGMVAILGAICVLVGPSIGTIATDANPALEIAGAAILLAGYLIIAVGIVMIVVALQRARSDSGPNKTP
jgi:putative Mn2+ efflux pump MntP